MQKINNKSAHNSKGTGDYELLDAMLIKNSRGIDYEVSHIIHAFHSSLDEQIQDIDQQCEEFERKISIYTEKLKVLKSYEMILKQCRNTGQLTYDQT